MHFLTYVFFGLLVFCVVPIAIAVAVPMRSLPLRSIWAAILFAIWALYPEGGDRASYVDFTGLVIVSHMLWIALVASIVIKLIWRAAKRRPAFSAPDAQSDAFGTFGLTTDGQTMATGAFVGATVVYAALMLGAQAKPPWTMFAWVAGIAAGILVLWPWARQLRVPASVRQFVTSLCISTVLVGAGVVLWILHSVDNVVSRAEAAAGGKPYCVQVQNPNSYKAATAKLDFSPQTMRAACSQSLCWSHHAILVVADGEQPSLFHWSYRSRSFVSGVVNSNLISVQAVCQPRQRFAEELPLF